MNRVAALVVACCSAVALAQADGGESKGRDVSELSLDELLNSPTSVASQKAESAREAPGVVTIVTREEILGMGARDLSDILMFVPGFSPPAIDLEGVLDVGFRGIWGHEGKILLMIDGEPMNELLYDDNVIAYHYPADSIQSVEIIRGPGSAIYGGWAELAVINVITRGAAELNGASVSAFYSERVPSGTLDQATLGARSFNLELGQKNVFGIDGLDASLSGFIGQATLSNGVYSDFAGDCYALSGQAVNGPFNSEIDPLFFNFALRYGDLKLRLIVDDYRQEERDSYGTDTGAATNVAPTEKFYTFIADASYDWKIGKLTITPRFTYKYQIPWQVQDQSVIDYFDIVANRYTLRVTGTYEFSDALHVTAGTDDYFEKAWLNHPTLVENGVVGSGNFLPGGCPGGAPGDCATQVSYSNLAFLAEGEYRSWVGNVTAGVRYEHHSEYGDSLVPRVAYTKAFSQWHFKALYSFAFRAPGIEDIAISPPGQTVQPERTRVAEAEIGYQPDENRYISANFFDITIQNPIVYSYSPSNPNVQYYQNYPKTGSQGFELDGRLRYPWGYLYANYSFYSSYSVFAQAAKNDVPVYEVPGVNDQLLAMPAHKVTIRAKLSMTDKVSFNPSLVYFSERWGVQSVDVNGNSIISQTPAVVLVNAFIDVRDLVEHGLDLDVGVYNMLDTQWSYLQAYNSSHAPIPAPGREVAVRLTFTPGR